MVSKVRGNEFHGKRKCRRGRRAIAGKAPRHRWHLRQWRHFRIGNLQNLKGPVGFESHPLRHLHSLSLVRWRLGWSSGVERLAALVVLGTNPTLSATLNVSILDTYTARSVFRYLTRHFSLAHSGTCVGFPPASQQIQNLRGARSSRPGVIAIGTLEVR